MFAAVLLPLLVAQAQTPEGGLPPGAATPTLSPGAAEVVHLAGSGTGDDVVLAYVQNSTATFDLSADQILYLRDIGVSSAAITAMLNRDNALHSQATAYTYDQKLYPPTAPPPAIVTPVQPPVSQASMPIEAPLTPTSEVPPPTYVSNPPVEVSYFYNDLSPYGSWVQVDGVGWCWQPRAVIINRAWRPYCDGGHWVYTDAGWFWQSDYSWGWAAFHYGRWHLHPRCGWVWLPDRVWGPAWVTWRYEGDHCGWAPLPPHADFNVAYGYRFNGVHVAVNFDFGLHADHFTFIALHDFHQHDFAHYRLPQTEVTKIYSHTTIINNYVVNNNTIVNQGIKVDTVQAATHTEFKKVAIRDVPAGSPGPASRLGSAKGDLAVYRPQLRTPVRQSNMVAQKVDDKHPVIQPTPLVTSRPNQAAARDLNGRPSASPRPATDRASAYLKSQPAAPNPPKPAPGEPTASSTMPSRIAEQQESPSPTRSEVSANQSYPSPQKPVHSNTPAPSEASRANESTRTSPPYYPKSYHQAAEVHMLPPVNSRPSDSHSQAPANQHRPAASDAGGKSSANGSQRNEQ
jgi:hypothetical protein